MRSAWNTRRAGLPAAKRAGVGIRRLMISTSSHVVLDRLLLPRRDDAARDRLRVPLLAVAPEDVGQCIRTQCVDEVCRRDLEFRVHAHVERRIVGIGEAPLAPVELHGGDTQVHEDHVGRRFLTRGQNAGEVALVELAFAGRGAGDVAEEVGDAGITIDGDENTRRAESSRDRLGVASGPEGTVDGDLALSWAQQIDRLLEQDRRVR